MGGNTCALQQFVFCRRGTCALTSARRRRRLYAKKKKKTRRYWRLNTFDPPNGVSGILCSKRGGEVVTAEYTDIQCDRTRGCWSPSAIWYRLYLRFYVRVPPTRFENVFTYHLVLRPFLFLSFFYLSKHVFVVLHAWSLSRGTIRNYENVNVNAHKSEIKLVQ